MALVIADDPNPVTQAWQQLARLQHPNLLIVAGVLCLPALWPLSRLFLPIEAAPGRDDGSWLDWSMDDGWSLSGPLLTHLLSLALVVACYGLLTAGVYWLLLRLLT